MDSILVIVTRQLGDVLLTTPLIRAARRRWPQARIDVLGFKGTLGLLRGNPDVDELIEVAGGGLKRSWPLVRRLWRRYDLALVGQPSDRAHLYGFVAGRRRSGLVTWHRDKSWWQRLLLDHAVEVPAERSHVVLEKLALLDPWSANPVGAAARGDGGGTAPVAGRSTGSGVGTGTGTDTDNDNDTSPSVDAVPPPAAPLPPALLARLRAGYLVVQVPSLVGYKQWPLAHYAEVVQALASDGRQLLLTGSPSDADRRRVAEVAAEAARRAEAAGRPLADDAVIDVAGTLDLNQVAALLAGAALYIGPDTSITHLAAACRVPVVALYGPVDPRIFGPWPQGHGIAQPWAPRSEAGRQQRATIVLLQGTQPCVPCNGAGCEGHDDSRSDCLQSISPARVIAEARARLAGPGRCEDTR